MDFGDALLEMRGGNRLRRKCWNNSEWWVVQDNLIKSTFGMPSLVVDNFDATDWEIVEEKKKKTLSEKIVSPNGFHGGNLFTDDVREHIKEFIEIFDKDWIGRLNETHTKYLNRKAKDIFGDRLMEAKKNG